MVRQDILRVPKGHFAVLARSWGLVILDGKSSIYLPHVK